MRKTITIAILFLHSFSFSQQQLIRISKGEKDPEEVSIAINPLNTQEVAASSNIDNYYYSTDGGKTWKSKKIISLHGIWGDPVVHFDSKGNLYYAHLGRNAGKVYPAWIDNIVVQRIDLEFDTCYADESIGKTNSKTKVQDKEWLSTDGSGKIFLSWTEFDKYQSRHPEHHSRIRFSYSADSGQTWSEPIVVSDVEGDCLDGDSTMEGATTCTDSKGNLYICWSGLNKIWLDKSTDGGLTFGTDRLIAEQHNGWEIPVKHIYRSNGMPFMLCNSSNSFFRDRLYVNWSDTRNGDADVFIKYSDDGGINWSPDIRVNDDITGNGAHQFSNNFCIDPVTGFLYCIFYDRRHSTSEAFMDTYMAISRDGGQTWKNYRLTPKVFESPGRDVFFGDYIDIDAVNNKVMPVYTSFSKGKLEVYTAEFDTTALPEYHEKRDLQATIINDTLYIHVAYPASKKLRLKLKAAGNIYRFKRDNNQGRSGESDFIFPATAFNEAVVVLGRGPAKKKVVVRKKLSDPN